MYSRFIAYLSSLTQRRSHDAREQEAEDVPSRLETALFVRSNAVNDFFGGWDPLDIDLMERYQVTDEQPRSGEIIDWLGIRTSGSYHQWLDLPETGLLLPELPIPDDGVHAEAIEYVALLTALEIAAARGDGVTIAELGASYGPWVSAAGVTALRTGFETVSLIAVEASSAGVDMCKEHLERNGLLDHHRVSVQIVHAAVSAEDGPVYFPRVDPKVDNGAQSTHSPVSQDYRGVCVEVDEVEGRSLRTLLKAVPEVDFLHMDLQGVEQELLRDTGFLQALEESVLCLFLATQSRLIEGLSLETLPSLGFQLVRERPTMFRFDSTRPDVKGWTTRDGGQFWVQNRLLAEVADANWSY